MATSVGTVRTRPGTPPLRRLFSIDAGGTGSEQSAEPPSEADPTPAPDPSPAPDPKPPAGPQGPEHLPGVVPNPNPPS